MIQTENKNSSAPMDKINASERNPLFVQLNMDESPGLPNKAGSGSLSKLILRKGGRGYSDSQIQNIASRKTYNDFDHEDENGMPQQSQTGGDSKSLTNFCLQLNTKINRKYKDGKTIEEESVGTKSSLESVCAGTFDERLFELGLPITQKTMSTPAHFSPQFSLNEQKSGKEGNEKENPKDAFDFGNSPPKYYSPVLTVCKNERDPELATITAKTLVELIDNPEGLNYIIVDCRYEYEYDGGHIKGAININSEEMLEKVFWTERSLLYNKTAVEDMKKDLKTAVQNPRNYKPFEKDATILSPPIIIFHCEFSQKRGPKAMRALKNKDSHLNIDRFPQLYYPQVFLLEGGYSEFHKQFPTYCNPEGGYVEMYSPDYKQEYSFALEREKKSWRKKFSIDIISSFDGVRSPKADFQY